MQRKISLEKAVLLIVLFAVLSSACTLFFANRAYQNDDRAIQNKYASLIELDQMFRHYYAGEIDEDAIENGILKGYMSGSGDRYGQYLTSEEWEAVENEMRGQGVGVGMLVQYDQTEHQMLVLNVFEGGPAKKAGMLPGDIITAIDGKTLAERGYDDAMNAALGEIGTEVVFTVLRGEESISLPVTRNTYEIQTVVYRVHEDGGKKTGIIRIEEFETATEAQFKKAIDTLLSQGVTGLVFDVRQNPGGELNSVIHILDYLLPDGGPIVHVRDKKETQTYYAEDKHQVDLPMAVLTDGNTASAAELFSAALRDYKKAVLVGDKTYGKGSIQSFIPLSDGGYLRVTFGLYDPPYGENYNGKGLSPDIAVPSDAENPYGIFYTLPTEQDNQMTAALAALYQK